jgi:hypothetical protein
MPGKLEGLDVDDLVERYGTGESELALSKRLGVSRGVIRRRLLEAGLSPRDEHAAMVVRMASAPPSERRRLTAAANTARRGKGVAQIEAIRKAAWKEQSQFYVGQGEREFGSWCQSAGAEIFYQRAVDRFNVDVALPPIAVEIHVTPTNPTRLRRFDRRSKEIMQRGWHLLYVWITRGHPLSPASADYALTWLHETEGQPAALREYRVIRGGGELVTAGHYDPNHLALIPTAV